MKKRAITLYINGDEYNLNIPVHHTLLQVIRDHLNLTDVKYGCGRGECGACTVLLDVGKGKRKTVLACVALAATMDGKSITTAAGLAKNGDLHPVQKAFVDESAIQCGFCTPGMVLKSVSILEKNPKPTEVEIRRGLEGNICRCTGYVKIIKAVQVASKKIAAGKR
ncbi:MAG: (2Fe-2S)-binding protein [Proteobacteria bacterium]|nr:(2Fe-2S)-binding protein [Pseudomonadota bacterium]